MNNLFICVCLLLILTSPVLAQLKWEKRDAELTPKPDQEQVVAEYGFTNSTDHAVTITSTKTSCGCTVVTTDKKIYQPKETGKVTATFKVGDRQGDQIKTIAVSTDDKTESTVLLTMKVHLPEIISIQPKFLIWRQGEETKPKKVIIKIKREEPFNIIGVTSRNDQIGADLKVIEAGRQYELSVTPKDLSHALRTLLELQASDPSIKQSLLHLMAGVATHATINDPTSQPVGSVKSRS
jgi:hypothetical protein